MKAEEEELAKVFQEEEEALEDNMMVDEMASIDDECNDLEGGDACETSLAGVDLEEEEEVLQLKSESIVGHTATTKEEQDDIVIQKKAVAAAATVAQQSLLKYTSVTKNLEAVGTQHGKKKTKKKQLFKGFVKRFNPKRK